MMIPFYLLLAAALLLGLLLLPHAYISRRYAGAIVTPEQAPPLGTAVVFGAGLLRDGSPTAVLNDRIRTAVRLYELGKVDQILMSGHADDQGYDEPGSMVAHALMLGVPPDVMLVDRLGSRTYQTCLRAQQTYGIQRAILVTQEFHLPRALATCEALGIEVVGVAADLRQYRQRAQQFWELREIAATLGALWDLYLDPPEQPDTPALGATRIHPLEADDES